jgi:hypothetical protein
MFISLVSIGGVQEAQTARGIYPTAAYTEHTQHKMIMSREGYWYQREFNPNKKITF